MSFTTTLDISLRLQTPFCTFLEKETSKNYYLVRFARMTVKRDSKAERVQHSQLSTATNREQLIVELNEPEGNTSDGAYC